MKKVLLTAAGVAVAIAGAVVWLQAAAPTIGPATATPAYIVVNTPTPVVITAQITNTSLIAGSVNLLKVDSTGKTLATVGVMRDDGMNGDAKAGDKTFSYRLSVNEATIKQVYYRVSAAFKGVLQRSLSNVVAVTVDPFQLPPDPGEAGTQTVEGIDSDTNGIRDDVQRYIALTFRESPSNRVALYQLAKSDQELLLAPNSDSAYEASLRVNAALDCLIFAVNAEAAIQQSDEIEARLINTSDRAHRYSSQQALLSGRSFRLTPESERKSRCSISTLP